MNLNKACIWIIFHLVIVRIIISIVIEATKSNYRNEFNTVCIING